MKIVVASCDRYSPLIPGFCFFFYKYWRDCPYPVEIFTGHSKSYLEELPFAISYLGDDRDWSGNMILYLDELCEDDIFLLLLEDYYLNEPPNAELIKQIVCCMETHPEIGYVNLAPWSDDLLFDGSVYRTYTEWLSVKPEADGRRGLKAENCPAGLGAYDLEKAQHLVNLRPGIWRKDFLRSLLVPGENGWEVEINGTERARRARKWMLGTFTHACPNTNMARYGIWRENPDGTTSRNWLVKELGEDHEIVKSLDACLGGKGLR